MFEVDSAQGLQSGVQPAILTAIAGKNENERSTILQKPEFLGLLPNGNDPVALPVKVDQIDPHFSPRFVQDLSTGVEALCFSNTESAPVLHVSPAEFGRHCLKQEARDYHSIFWNDALSDISSIAEICNGSQETYARKIVDVKLSALNTILNEIKLKQSSLMALSVPTTYEGKLSVLWKSEGTETHAGHATLAVGFITDNIIISRGEAK